MLDARPVLSVIKGYWMFDAGIRGAGFWWEFLTEMSTCNSL
ncbi:MAG: hypothetical protein ACYS0C_04170 [Planctomycetota bacterium]